MTRPIRAVVAPTFSSTIFIAGDVVKAMVACRVFCDSVGLCVTVTPTTYVYSGGAEVGVIVGLINYPRFPGTPEALNEVAERLARVLLDELEQGSCSIQSGAATTWLTRRGD